MAKNLILWIVIAVVLMSVFSNFQDQGTTAQEIPYSQFLSEVDTGRIDSVTIRGPVIRGTRSDGSNFSTYSPETDNNALIGQLMNGGVSIRARSRKAAACCCRS